MPRGLAALAALVVLSLAAGCSGDDDDEPETPTEAPEATPTETASAGPVTVQVEAGAAEEPVFVRAFLPDDVTVRIGDSVAWTAPAGEHTVTFLGEAEPFPLIVPEPASPADAVLNPRVVNPEPDPPPSRRSRRVAPSRPRAAVYVQRPMGVPVLPTCRPAGAG